METLLQEEADLLRNEALTVIKSGLEYLALSYQDKLIYWSKHSRPGRWPKLLAALSYAESLIECFDFEEEQWIVMTEKPGHVFGSTMCYMNGKTILIFKSLKYLITGKLYTIGGVQSKQVDQYDVETDNWKDFFPSLQHCRVAHSSITVGDTLYVAGGSAKANANFGPGL